MPEPSRWPNSISDWHQPLRHAGRETRPLLGFHRQLPPSPRGELVEFCSTPELGRAPFGVDETTALAAVQVRIWRPLLDDDRFVGGFFEPFGDAIAVSWTARQRLHDESVEHAVQEF